MQGVPGSGTIGVHGGGHFTINGDPGGDLFTSPGDPAFFLHHGQIDRVWSIWYVFHSPSPKPDKEETRILTLIPHRQALDYPNRKNAISGTGTFLDAPPSANTTLNTPINLGYSGGTTVLMSELMSTVSGQFCYMYL
jgi:tyrosinase